MNAARTLRRARTPRARGGPPRRRARRAPARVPARHAPREPCFENLSAPTPTPPWRPTPSGAVREAPSPSPRSWHVWTQSPRRAARASRASRRPITRRERRAQRERCSATPGVQPRRRRSSIATDEVPRRRPSRAPRSPPRRRAPSHAGSAPGTCSPTPRRGHAAPPPGSPVPARASEPLVTFHSFHREPCLVNPVTPPQPRLGRCAPARGRPSTRPSPSASPRAAPRARRPCRPAKPGSSPVTPGKNPRGLPAPIARLRVYRARKS